MERANKKWDTALDWWGRQLYTTTNMSCSGRVSVAFTCCYRGVTLPPRVLYIWIYMAIFSFSTYKGFRMIIQAPECQWASLEERLGLPGTWKPQIRSLHRSTLQNMCSEFSATRTVLKSLWLCCMMPAHTHIPVCEDLITNMTPPCPLLFTCKPLTRRKALGSAAGGFRPWSHSGLGAGS